MNNEQTKKVFGTGSGSSAEAGTGLARTLRSLRLGEAVAVTVDKHPENTRDSIRSTAIRAYVDVATSLSATRKSVYVQRVG